MATKPADWWRPDTYPLLISYCKHVANAKRIDWLLAGFSNDQLKNEDIDWIEWLACLDKMLRARDRESRALVNLARSCSAKSKATNGISWSMVSRLRTRFDVESLPPGFYRLVESP